MERKILDHGYLKLVEAWGSDQRIVEAARMSTGKGFLGWGPVCRTCNQPSESAEEKCPSPSPGVPLVDCGRGGHYFDQPGDEKLLCYLWENKHATPFEMAGATFEVQAPIFVFREWHRHRVPFGYNEASARYAPLPDLNYVPSVDRLILGGGHLTKQAGTIAGAEALTQNAAEQFQDRLRRCYSEQEDLYRWALEAGVPKELARVHLPVARYSRMRATGNLRGWLAFLTLRDHEKAQWEIRCYAKGIASYLAELFPRTYAIFRGEQL